MTRASPAEGGFPAEVQVTAAWATPLEVAIWALVASVVAWSAHALLSAHVLWRTHPSRQPLAQAVGALIALLAGAVLALALRRCFGSARALVMGVLSGGGRLLGGGRRALGRTVAAAAALLAAERDWLACSGTRVGFLVASFPLASAALVVTGGYALVLALHPPVLEIDDVYWWMFVAGFGLTDVPDEHIWASHHLAGRALAILYRSSPDGPWYGLYLLGTAILAHLAIAYALARRLGAGGLGLFSLQFLLIDLYLAHHLQFTMEAALAGAGGMLLFARALERGERHPGALMTAAAALLLLGSFVRTDACFLLVGVTGPVIVAAAWPLDRVAVRRLGVMALVLAAVLGGALENRWFYARDPRWANFWHQYGILRQEIVETRRPFRYDAETRPIFAAVGWCEADLRLMQEVVYYDDERITDENVAYLNERFPRPWRLDPREYGRELSRILGDSWVEGTLPLVLLLLVTLSWRGAAAAGSGLLVWLGALFYFLNFAKPPPERVYLPVVCGLLHGVAFLARPGALPPVGLRPRWPVTCLRQALVLWAIGLGLLNLGPLAAAGVEREAKAAHLKRTIRRLSPRPDELYVVLANHFPYEDIQPFGDFRFMRGLRMLGTYHNSPFNKTRMEEFGVTDVYRSLYERDDVYLISTERVNRWLAAAIQNHHGVEVEFQVRQIGAGFTVYRVRKAAPPG